MAKQDNGKNTPKKTPSSRREIDYSKAKLVKDKPKAEEGWVEGKDPVTGKKMWYRERVTEPDRFPGGPGTPPEPKLPTKAPKMKPSNVSPKPGTPPKLPRKTDSTYEQEVVYMDDVKEEPKNVAAQLDVSGRYEGKENTEYSNPHMRQILFPEAGTGGYTNATQMMTDRTTGKPVDPIKSYDDKGNYVPVFLGDKPYWEIVPKSAVSLAPGQEVNQNSVETMLSNTKNKVARVNTTQEFGKETLTGAGIPDKSEQGIGIGLQDVRTLPSTELKNKSQSPYVNQFEEEKYKNITAPKFKKGGTVKGYFGGGNVQLSEDEKKKGYQVRNGRKYDASGRDITTDLEGAQYSEKQQQNAQLKQQAGSALGGYGTGYYASQGNSGNEGKDLRSNTLGAVSNAGAIGGVVGGVAAIGDQIGDPIRKDLEQTDAQGNVKNKDAAITGAVIGTTFSPSKRLEYEGGLTDVTGEAYIKSIEDKAKKEIAEKQFASNMNDRNARINAAEGGTIKGKGGPKSDSILSRINNKGIPSGSFITPAENNDKAKAIRKHILGDNPEKQAQFKKEGGEAKAEVAVSNGEHLFTPAEKKKIIAYLGEEILEELAPNAEENDSEEHEMSEGEHKEMMKMDMEHKAKGGEISKNKAREIMRDGTVHGKPLTDKQKRYFGWVIGGRKACGGEVKGYQDGTPKKGVSKPKSVTPLSDSVNAIITERLERLKNPPKWNEEKKSIDKQDYKKTNNTHKANGGSIKAPVLGYKDGGKVKRANSTGVASADKMIDDFYANPPKTQAELEEKIAKIKALTRSGDAPKNAEVSKFLSVANPMVEKFKTKSDSAYKANVTLTEKGPDIIKNIQKLKEMGASDKIIKQYTEEAKAPNTGTSTVKFSPDDLLKKYKEKVEDEDFAANRNNVKAQMDRAVQDAYKKLDDVKKNPEKYTTEQIKKAQETFDNLAEYRNTQSARIDKNDINAYKEAKDALSRMKKGSVVKTGTDIEKLKQEPSDKLSENKNQKQKPKYEAPTNWNDRVTPNTAKKSLSAPKVGTKAQAKQMSEMGAVEPKQISSQELITPAGKVKEEEIKTPISSEELVKMQPDANKVTPTPEKKKWWEGVGNLSEYAAPAFQIGMGLSALNKAGKRPVDAMDKDFIASVEKAKQDATFGYTPEEKFAIDTMNENLTKAARFEARNLSGGSAAVAQSNERAAVNDAYMRGLDSLIKGKQLQMSKQQYANELIAAKQDKSRQLFGDTMTAWMQNQQSGSALLGAGIQNLIGAKRYQDEIEAQKNINQAGKAWTKTIG